MLHEWMLILVTAVAPTEYNVVALSPFESLDECYRQSVYIDADIQRADNQEMICIKLDSLKLSYAQPNVLRGW